MGVEPERIYVDHGLTGTNRETTRTPRSTGRVPGRWDTLVVTKLDRLARSLPDARAIADELTTRQISLSLGGSVRRPASDTRRGSRRPTTSGSIGTPSRGSPCGIG